MKKKLFMMAVGVIMGAVAAFGMIPEQAKAVRPVFTGDKNVDYIAEKMVKSAGVKKNMSADQKVKRIYHYMTTHFHHVHYHNSGKSYKVYYSLKKYKKQINAYKLKTDALQKKGEIKYNYKNINELWCMQRRIGVCTDHAAIFKILCNHVGVKAEVCRGQYKNRSGKRSPHSWNYAVVNGKKYYYDVDVEIQNYGNGQGDYYWYKKTLSEAKKTHVFQ